MSGSPLADAWLRHSASELVAVRRDLHAHPELGRQEHRTTALLNDRLEAAGLSPKLLSSGTGLVCDVGTADDLWAATAEPVRVVAEVERRGGRVVAREDFSEPVEPAGAQVCRVMAEWSR